MDNTSRKAWELVVALSRAEAAAVTEAKQRSRRRYCGMCDKWFASLRSIECPLCGADTDQEPKETRS
jgi:hypothetical protein